MKNKIMNFFSDLGRSLMMPIAALAACGIVLGLTSAFMKPQVQGAIPFLAATVPFCSQFRLQWDLQKKIKV